MRIYFFSGSENQVIPGKIVEFLNKAGALVMSNLKKDDLFEFSEKDLSKFDQNGEFLLDKMDGLVIAGGAVLAETGYMVALAITHKKPILYLLEKGQEVDGHLKSLMADKEIAKILTVEFFAENNLENKILDFLYLIETGKGKELPTIKFTLRITSRIERYLHWKTHNTKLSKADFLREMIEKQIDQDGEYQKYVLKNKGD